MGAGRTERRKGGLTRWHRHHVQSSCSRQPPACCTAPAACASPCHRRCSPPGLAQMPAAEAEAAIKRPCAVWSDSQFRTPLQIYLWMGPIIHGKVRTSRDVVGRKFKLLCALISVCLFRKFTSMFYFSSLLQPSSHRHDLILHIWEI